MAVEMQTQPLSHLPVGPVLNHPDRQHDQVVDFLADPAVLRESEDQAARPVLVDAGYLGSDEPDPLLVLRALVIPLETLAMGPDVDVEDRRLQVASAVLPGDDGLLDRIGAADGGAVVVVYSMDVPGADALDPGDPVGLLSVGWAEQPAPAGSGCAQDALELDARDDVRKGAVTVVGNQAGVERLESRAGDDGADRDAESPGLHVEIDRPCAALPRAEPAPSADGTVDHVGVRISLLVEAVDSLPVTESHVEGIRELHRADLRALAAAGALLRRDESRLLLYRRSESARNALESREL